MGKWSDRLKTLNAQATLPALPAEAPFAGNAGYAGPVAGVVSDPIEGGDAVEEMSLAQFARSGQFRRVHSKMLDEIILLAADNADLPDFGDTVVYRAAEAQLWLRMSQDEIRAYHELKVCFDGIIERATPDESQIDAAELLGRGVDEIAG